MIQGILKCGLIIENIRILQVVQVTDTCTCNIEGDDQAKQHHTPILDNTHTHTHTDVHLQSPKHNTLTQHTHKVNEKIGVPPLHGQ